jgi:hypothetical protein
VITFVRSTSDGSAVHRLLHDEHSYWCYRDLGFASCFGSRYVLICRKGGVALPCPSKLTPAFVVHAAGRQLKQQDAGNAVCAAQAVASAVAAGGGSAVSLAQAQSICSALSGKGGVAQVRCSLFAWRFWCLTVLCGGSSSSCIQNTPCTAALWTLKDF